jgi:hypothetical protein
MSHLTCGNKPKALVVSKFHRYQHSCEYLDNWTHGVWTWASHTNTRHNAQSHTAALKLSTVWFLGTAKRDLWFRYACLSARAQCTDFHSILHVGRSLQRAHKNSSLVKIRETEKKTTVRLCLHFADRAASQYIYFLISTNLMH